MKCHYKHTKGFTFIEAMLAMVLLGIAACGLLLPFSAGAAVQEEGINRTLAMILATDLMEQIINTPYDQIVSTYDGYSDSQGTMLDGNGSPISGDRYYGYSRTAACTAVYMPQQSGMGQTIFIRTEVTVYCQGQEVCKLHRLIGDYDVDSAFNTSSIGS